MNATLISPKVSYVRRDGKLRIIILGKIAKWKETLLAVWLMAWLGIGAVMVYYWRISDDRDFKLAVLIFMVFWGYYLLKVGRVWLFRIGGNELIEVDGEALNLKRSIFTFGKSRSYFLENIKDMRLVEQSPKSWSQHYGKSWWVLGGQRLTFMYYGSPVVFGMQLDDREAAEILKLIRRRMKEASERRERTPDPITAS